MLRLSGSKRLTAASPAVAAALGLAIALGSGQARAQTATDLDCTGCVGTNDLGQKAVTRSKIQKRSVNRSKLSTDLQVLLRRVERQLNPADRKVDTASSQIRPAPFEVRPVLATLNAGETKIIFDGPPYTVRARCMHYIFDPDPQVGTNVDRVELSVSSSRSGWLHQDSGAATFQANQEVVTSTRQNVAAGDAFYGGSGGLSVLGPGLTDGLAFLWFDGGEMNVGLNVLDHDCVVAGTAFLAFGK